TSRSRASPRSSRSGAAPGPSGSGVSGIVSARLAMGAEPRTPDPRLDLRQWGDPLDVVEWHRGSPDRRRRTLRPIHVLLAGLLGVGLGFLIAHATLAA